MCNSEFVYFQLAIYMCAENLTLRVSMSQQERKDELLAR
jgi:hypothetical protein